MRNRPLGKAKLKELNHKLTLLADRKIIECDALHKQVDALTQRNLELVLLLDELGYEIVPVEGK